MIEKWVCVNDGEHYNVGQVVTVVGVDFALVKSRPVYGPQTMRLYKMSAFTNESPFFDTEKELDEYIAWFETLDEGKPKLVHFQPTGKTH